MATQSSWRSQTAGTQRWGNGSASARSNNNNSSSSHGTGSNSSSTAGHDTAAAAAPSSGRQGGGATHTNAFPPLGAKSAAVDSHEATQRDRLLFLLVGLVGNTIVATTRTGVQYVGILSSTSTAAAAATSSTPAQDSLGIILSSAQEILPGQAPGQQPKLGPLKKMLVIQGQDLDSFAAKDVALDVPASMSRTDASAGALTVSPLRSQDRTCLSFLVSHTHFSLPTQASEPTQRSQRRPRDCRPAAHFRNGQETTAKRSRAMVLVLVVVVVVLGQESAQELLVLVLVVSALAVGAAGTNLRQTKPGSASSPTTRRRCTRRSSTRAQRTSRKRSGEPISWQGRS